MALGVAEAGFVAPEDFVPVGAAGLDAVFLDQVPDDLFEGNAACGEVQARERPLQRVVVRRSEYVEVAARITSRGMAVVLVHKQRLRVVKIVAGLVAVGRSQRLEPGWAGIRPVVHAQGHLNVEVHPVAERHRPTEIRISRHLVAYDQLVGTQPCMAEVGSCYELVDLADAA